MAVKNILLIPAVFCASGQSEASPVTFRQTTGSANDSRNLAPGFPIPPKSGSLSKGKQ